MKIIINNIRVSLDDEIEIIKEIVSKKINITKEDILNFKVIKQSIDARRKSNINFVYSVLVEIKSNKNIIYQGDDLKVLAEEKDEPIIKGNRVLKSRPI